MNDKRMKLRYDGTCRLCGTALPARSEAIYERDTKTVRCVTCEPTEPEPAVEPALDATAAGASARREYERRKAAREERVRARFPRLGGVLLAVFDDPQTTKAWQTGAVGEEKLGRALNDLLEHGVVALHDRKVPGTRANIDHLAITPGGVWVIDAKKYRGRPEHKIDGGLLRPRVDKLLVGGRDRTKLIDGVHRQVEVVRNVVGDVPVRGALCFIDADWPLFGGSFTIREVEVLSRKRLGKRLREEEGSIDVEQVAAQLMAQLPPA